LQCIYCSKFFFCYQLPQHINLHHKSVAIRCTFSKTCRTYFLTKEALDEHVLKIHLSGKVVEILKCTFCEKQFSKFCEVKNHAQKIHGETLHKCTSERSCSFIISSNAKLLKHLQEQHAEAETERLRTFSCKKCNHKSKSLSNLNQHMRVHGTKT
jgi:hypothetical protein